ncbi:hypothetical protein I4U23_003806 [Adineta vaga]|nr:hypothetical protein I4U23_003806 [Adineta vaga]
MGLEAALYSIENSLSLTLIFYDYSLSGASSFTIGVTLVILCRQQIYVLIPIFGLLLFQMNHPIKKVVAYGIIIKRLSTNCHESYSSDCGSTFLVITWANSILAGISVVFTLVTVISIKQACNPCRLASQQPTPSMMYITTAT